MYRRKLEGKTNYKKRLKYLVSSRLRMVIRRSNKAVYVQIVEYSENGDKTITSVTSRELAKLGYKGSYKNTSTAYLTGLLIAKKLKDKSIKDVLPDLGFYSPISGSLVFAVIKGAKDGGLNLKIDDSILPSEARIKGEHLKSNQNFEEIKKKILGK